MTMGAPSRRRRAPLLLALVPWRAACAPAVASFVATDADNARPGPKYNVQLLTGALPDAARPPPGEARAVRMRKRDGRTYLCHVPAPPAESDEAEGSDAEPADLAMPDVAQYLLPLQQSCFYRLEGWWTYEVCFLRSIRQFHQEKSVVQQDYKLGVYWTPSGLAESQTGGLLASARSGQVVASAAGGTVLMHRTADVAGADAPGGGGGGALGGSGAAGGEGSAGRGGVYISGELVRAESGGPRHAASAPRASASAYFRQTYGNGTLCDLTGQPRQTELRIHCAPGEKSYVGTVEEVATCKYVVTFHTDLVCSHPAFASAATEQSAQAATPIRCEPLGPDGLPIPAAARRADAADGAGGGASGGGAEGAVQPGWEAARAASLAHTGGGTLLHPASPAAIEAARRVALAAAEQQRTAAFGGGGSAGPPPPVQYDLGQCILHKSYHYRGVVIGYDPVCRQSEAWVRAMGVDRLQRGTNQPFYHVLVDTRDRPGTQLTYVAQENVVPDAPAEPLQHPLLAELFDGYSGEHFVPKPHLRAQYPLGAGGGLGGAAGGAEGNGGADAPGLLPPPADDAGSAEAGAAQPDGGGSAGHHTEPSVEHATEHWESDSADSAAPESASADAADVPSDGHGAGAGADVPDVVAEAHIDLAAEAEGQGAESAELAVALEHEAAAEEAGIEGAHAGWADAEDAQPDGAVDGAADGAPANAEHSEDQHADDAGAPHDGDDMPRGVALG